MAADQQFCLRWNNHQSTLVSVFDSLLEKETLVDCTLAAEGQYLKAHKVVLCACSPYLETLLSQHYEKHPIVILKDVKFTELKSMMDYMYRGEVNISQDQLGTFLKAAESLQIKGLSENGEGDARDVGSTTKPPPRKPPATPAAQPELAQSPAHRSRDGSVSPSSRKRRRLRRNSDDGDNHLDSNSCDLPVQAQSTPVVPNIPASITTTPIRTPIVKPEVNDRLDHNSLPPESGLLKEKIEPAEPLLEPKTEYLEDLNNDDSVEDLTLDDDDEMDMSQMSNMSNMSRPGPSHGADISNQGFTPWQLGNQSGTDEVFMAAQEAVNAHRDSQAGAEAFRCLNCEHPFITQESLVAHLRQVTQGWQVEEHCFICDYLSNDADDLMEHLQLLHHEEDMLTTYICQECDARFKAEQDADCHSKTCEMNLKFEEELSKHVALGNVDELGYCYAVKVENVKSLGKGSGRKVRKVMVLGNKPLTRRDLRKTRSKKYSEITIEPIKKPVRSGKKVQENSKSVKSVTENLHDTESFERIYKFFNSGDLEEIQKGYHCPDCNKIYTSYMSAKVHLKTLCNKEADKKCHICDYRTRQAANLTRHMKLVHFAPEYYICDKCGKEYKSKGHFSHHVKFDCGSAKPLKCPLCDFATKIPGILNTHLLKVHNKLNLNLEARKLRRSTLLEGLPEPIKVPDGYECPDCGIVVKLPEGYKKHRKRVHQGEEGDFQCLVETCDYTTNNNHNLRQHLKRVHCLFSRVRNDKLELLDFEDEDLGI